MGDGSIVDYMNGILHDPWRKVHMGVTAENVAATYGITREMQDELALESQRRAARAIAEGRFKSQTVPLEAPAEEGRIRFRLAEARRPAGTPGQRAESKPGVR